MSRVTLPPFGGFLLPPPPFFPKSQVEAGCRAVEEAACGLCLRCLPSKRMPLEGEPVKGREFALPPEARKLLSATPGPADPRDDSDGDSDEEDALTQDRDVDSQDEESLVVEEAALQPPPPPADKARSASKSLRRFFPELEPGDIKRSTSSSTSLVGKRATKGSSSHLPCFRIGEID